jgi:hypothetical protein
VKQLVDWVEEKAKSFGGNGRGIRRYRSRYGYYPTWQRLLRWHAYMYVSNI